MNKRWFKLIQFLFFLLIGSGLIYLSLGKLSFLELTNAMASGDYKVAFPVFVVSLLGYFFRSRRLQLMLHGMGEKCRLKSVYAALCMGYLVSFVVPRLGEVTRALVVKRTDKVRFDLTLLAIIYERVVDTLTLGVLFGLSLFVFPKGRAFFGEIVNSNVSPIGGLKLLLLMAFVSMILLAIVRLKPLSQWIMNYSASFKGINRILNKTEFWLLTAGIWICYFLMTWLWFRIFPETNSLTILDAFIVMIAGSFGRSMPVQGGSMGVYHFVVSRILLLLGVNLLTGNALAFVIHGAQAVITLITGVLSYIWMLYDVNRRQSRPENQTSIL